MNTIQSAICSMAIAGAATMTFGASAQAISFGVSAGNSSPTGELNQGAFSDFAAREGFATVSFNDLGNPFEAIEYSSGRVIDGFATYTFSNLRGSSKVVPTTSGEMRWSPDGANNEINDTSYLQVFSNSTVTIDLAETLNYFGINWGSASPGNVFSFFMGDTMVGSFNVDDIAAEGFAFTGTKSGQGTGYIDFRSESEADNFNRIVISQIGGGGFETDNHTFRVGTGQFSPDAPKDVPEPGALLGLAALGLLGTTKVFKK
ncbi:MAG: PEP-CTERM sorting domain-containing protein [Leptolyngbyaceae bacterium]|nr:PEP-CTERM sorting domain-containing protein [Leptolyngbyaceae bacterium]